MNPITILDCTLRDGGYFNNWRFDKDMAIQAVTALNHAGVNIIEVGFKAPAGRKSAQFEGLFRYCTESQLQFLKNLTRSQYAFMINTSDFITEGGVDKAAMERCVFPAEDSLFNWVRMATHFATFEQAVEQARILKSWGYQTTINLMGMSLLGKTQIIAALNMIDSDAVDVFYFADSFGGLRPEDVTANIELIRQHYSGKLGIHTHDNCGLAFANTLQAMEMGVDIVDGTITGMGRGAGNLKTEQLLLHLYFKEDYLHLNPSALLEVIDNRFSAMQRVYGWGWDYTYMLSGLKNIHPTYCQQLRGTGRYSISQVSDILNAIEPDKRSKFQQNVLQQASESLVRNLTTVSDVEQVTPPFYQPESCDEILVIATGPSVKTYQEEIATFIKQRQPGVIECNPKNTFFAEATENAYVATVLNWVRLEKLLTDPHRIKVPIVTGLTELPITFYTNDTDICYFPCYIQKEQVVIENNKITLPAYVVGMYAIGLALVTRPKQVYLAGFDGYEDISNPQHQEMMSFWQCLDLSRFISLTPTSYNLSVSSIYGYIL